MDENQENCAQDTTVANMAESDNNGQKPANSGTIKKPDSPETKQNKALLIRAMIENRGNITNACKSAGLDRSTYYSYEKSDSEFKTACRDVTEMNLDFVEDKLFKSIENDNLSSVYFYLKCKGKKRGYIEGQVNINMDMDDQEKQAMIVNGKPIWF